MGKGGKPLPDFRLLSQERIWQAGKLWHPLPAKVLPEGDCFALFCKQEEPPGLGGVTGSQAGKLLVPGGHSAQGFCPGFVLNLPGAGQVKVRCLAVGEGHAGIQAGHGGPGIVAAPGFGLHGPGVKTGGLLAENGRQGNAVPVSRYLRARAGLKRELRQDHGPGFFHIMPVGVGLAGEPPGPGHLTVHFREVPAGMWLVEQKRCLAEANEGTVRVIVGKIHPGHGFPDPAGAHGVGRLLPL